MSAESRKGTREEVTWNVRWLAGMVVLLVGVGAIVFSSSLDRNARAQTPLAKPNIVLILTDDEDVKIHAFMPKTKVLLEDRGATFVNAFVTYALCCPSRATGLRGQYPHNTKIEANTPPFGGFQKFLALGSERSTIATWLQAAGYRTMLAGKYLNGYGTRGTDPQYVPPGWTEWYSGVGAPPYQDFTYQLNENGRVVAYGARPEDYLTDVIARKAVETIQRAARDRQPFFLYLSPYTPHQPATPAPRHAGLFADARLPRPPSFNEEDVTDKPPIMQRPRLNAVRITELEALYRKRLQSLQAIDDLVETVVQALQAAGQMENTYILYTSDNGFHMGEHRLRSGKALAYEEDIRVPFILRGPGVPGGRRIAEMVLNTDIAPTFAEMAGIQPADFVDGRSFLPLARSSVSPAPSASPPPWRTAFLLELRGLPPARQEPAEPGAEQVPVGFNAIRTSEWVYIEWLSGARELYDLRSDPFQLENRIQAADRGLVSTLAARLAELGRCAGATCRRSED